MEEHIVSGVTIIITFLTIAVFSSLILKRIRFPYTIGLVLVGTLFGILAYKYDALEPMRNIELNPGMILYIILPTLIFDAAIDIDASTLMKNLIPILLLAILGLLLSTVIIGVGVSGLTSMSIASALVFGTLISATDPVAVIALFKEIGAPKRLVTLIDGESLFNDATAIVLFTIFISMFSGAQPENTTLFTAAWRFVYVLVGGLGIGGIIGYLGVQMLRLEKGNLLLQITVSLIMAYVSFIVADHYLHVSGVMSTLAAGLIFRLRAEEVIKRSNIETVEHFWDYFSFVANSFVFLLLGLTEVSFFHNIESLKSVFFSFLIVIIPIVMIARATGIYLLIPLYNRFNRKNDQLQIPVGYQTILFWGGLRGAVPVALVLAIPADFMFRDLIIHYTLGYILFTLLIQGTTIKKVMDKLGIRPEKSDFDDREILHRSYPLGSTGMVKLVTNGMIRLFEEEGFFIRERESEEGIEYILKRGKITLLIEQMSSTLEMTAEPVNIGYLNTVLYETLLELNSSVESIKNAADPEKMKELTKVDINTQISFDVVQFLHPDMMTASLVSNNKETILREMVQILVHKGIINDYEAVLSEVLEREESMSTGMGMGIAMPHARSEYVQNLTALIGICKKGVDFKSLDKEPVYILILILSPKSDSGPHLQFLAAMSKILMNEQVRNTLISAEHGTELFKIIEEASRNNQ